MIPTPRLWLGISLGLLLSACVSADRKHEVSTVIPDVLRCTVSLQPAQWDAVVHFEIQNLGRAPLYLRRADAPWLNGHKFNVRFSSDLPRSEEPVDWDTDPQPEYYLLETREPLAIAPGATLSGKLSVERSGVRIVRLKSSVYVDWDFQLVVYRSNPRPQTGKKPNPIVSRRIHGRFKLPKVE